MRYHATAVWLSFLLGLFLSSCGPDSGASIATPRPTETLSAIAPGTTVIIDICQADPNYPDCAGLRRTLTPRGDLGQVFVDPLGRFAFLYPSDWYTMTVTPDPSDGVRVMDAPSLQESTRWVALHVFQNPNRASLQVWIAEHGIGWLGTVTDQEEGYINGVPVLRQRLENNDPNMGGPYIYILFWYPHEDWILRWTAWPGEQAETLHLLEQMVSSFHKP